MRLESTEACRARLRLALAVGVPRKRLITLLQSAGTPEQILHRLGESPGLSLPAGQDSLFSLASPERVEEQLRRGERLRPEILAWSDAEYPPLLKHTQSPPVVLFVTGDPGVLSKPAVAVVGSRRCSDSGRHVAEKLAGQLAAEGFVVVSGLARGIDSAAHRGALSAGGKTVAVLGCGVDVCYPREHERLVREIEERGAVVSEFPLGTPPLRQNFPVRNRTISGLSLGVLVVEAREGSGALGTAFHALEQGREVFVVPGDITITSTSGSNRLLKEGAKPVTCSEDVMEELAPQVEGRLERVVKSPVTEALLAEEEEVVLGSLSHSPVHVDELCERLGRPATTLLPVLLALELRGLVKQEPGNRFVRGVET